MAPDFAVYIFAQVMGGVVGAGLVYGQYIHAIDIFEGGRHIRTKATASLFSSFAVSAYFLRRLPCAMLTCVIAAIDHGSWIT